MTNSYFLKFSALEKGPYEEAQIAQVFADDRVNRNTRCKPVGSREWKFGVSRHIRRGWRLRSNILLGAWLVFSGVNLGFAQVAVRIPDMKVQIRSISHFGEETWIDTEQGLYRIKGDSPPEKIFGRIYLFSHFGEETWVATKQGLYRIKGD